MKRIVQIISLLALIGSLGLYSLSERFEDTAWFYFLLGSLYSLFSLFLFSKLLEALSKKPVDVLTSALALPMKMLSLFAFCFFVTKAGESSLLFALAGLLTFLPAVLLGTLLDGTNPS